MMAINCIANATIIVAIHFSSYLFNVCTQCGGINRNIQKPDLIELY